MPFFKNYMRKDDLVLNNMKRKRCSLKKKFFRLIGVNENEFYGVF